MAGDVSFDLVSDFDEQELRNALDQVRREVQQRYDFKGATVQLTQEKTELVLVTDDEFRARAVKDLIESKAVRRGLSLKIFDWGTVEPAGGNKVRQVIGLRRGLTDDLARKLVKQIRDEFPKVQPRIQGDAIRVASKSKDELQKVIARLRELDVESRSSSRTTGRRAPMPGSGRTARIVMIIVAVVVVAGMLAALIPTAASRGPVGPPRTPRPRTDRRPGRTTGGPDAAPPRRAHRPRGPRRRRAADADDAASRRPGPRRRSTSRRAGGRRRTPGDRAGRRAGAPRRPSRSPTRDGRARRPRADDRAADAEAEPDRVTAPS